MNPNLQPLFRMGQFMAAVTAVRNGGGTWQVTYGPGYAEMIGVSGQMKGQQVTDSLTAADVENFMAVADLFYECRDSSKVAAGVNLTTIMKELTEAREMLARMENDERGFDATNVKHKVNVCISLVRAVQHHRATDRDSLVARGKR